jgi:SET domain-containing protein
VFYFIKNKIYLNKENSVTMMIQIPTKIYISQSTIHGLGVFAKEIINEGEVIEECPILTLPIKKGESSPLLIDYRFNWPQGTEPEEQVVSWGYGSLYNHSNNANAYWVSDLNKRTFIFIANRTILPNEEICVWYGDTTYWEDGRGGIEVID